MNSIMNNVTQVKPKTDSDPVSTGMKAALLLVGIIMIATTAD